MYLRFACAFVCCATCNCRFGLYLTLHMYMNMYHERRHCLSTFVRRLYQIHVYLLSQIICDAISESQTYHTNVCFELWCILVKNAHSVDFQFCSFHFL